MTWQTITALSTVVAHWTIVIALSVRVILRRRSVGVSTAWLTLIVLVPLLGAIAYLMFGELRLGRRRERRAIELADRYTSWVRQMTTHIADPAKFDADLVSITQQAHRIGGLPAMDGNDLVILDGCESVLRAIIEDIDAAERSIDMEFYIWEEGGTADDVLAALVRAAERGVSCRVLLDSIGSGRFLAGRSACDARRAGVRIVEALPARVLRTLRRRQDLRLHRKIIVIDDRIAYTGSLNIVDARTFKQTAGVGQWVDIMVRMRGPAVAQLEASVLYDWEIETGEDLIEHYGIEPGRGAVPGSSVVQAVASGPGARSTAAYHTLLSAIFAARERLVITTPYFVPDETIEAALFCAVERGVDVTIIVPRRSDSKLAQLAGFASFGPLLDAGVHVALFNGGLLHTKAVAVDDRLALVGSVNLDQRSFWLNYEITLAVYDSGFVTRLNALLGRYLEDCDTIDADEWRQRGIVRRFCENTVRLFSPLL